MITKESGELPVTMVFHHMGGGEMHGTFLGSLQTHQIYLGASLVTLMIYFRLMKRKEKNERANWLINGFRNAVTDAGLSDVHTEGYLYTWFKCLGTSRAVEERLDRALATDAWQRQFPDAVLENLPAPSSDHYPIMLLCEPGPRQKRNHSRFRFENALLFDPEFKNFVNNKWNSYGSYPIVDKLELCAAVLTVWNQNHFQQLKKEINDCRKQIAG
jgi:hypothetical protein